MRIVLLFVIIFFYSNFSHTAEFMGKFQQGSFILGKTEPGSEVIIDKKKLEFPKMGTLLLVWAEIEKIMLLSEY